MPYEEIDDYLRAGGDPNADKFGSNLLAAACSVGDERAVSLLLSYGADANRTLGDDGSKPLLMASFLGHEIIVDLLLGAGADPNSSDRFGITAAMAAAKACSLSVVALLVGRGANIYSVDFCGRNLLHWACVGGDCDDLVRYLIAGGVNVTQMTRDGDQPIDYSIKFGRDRVRRLLMSTGNA